MCAAGPWSLFAAPVAEDVLLSNLIIQNKLA
jgi:hypothetical protein